MTIFLGLSQDDPAAPRTFSNSSPVGTDIAKEFKCRSDVKFLALREAAPISSRRPDGRKVNRCGQVEQQTFFDGGWKSWIITRTTSRTSYATPLGLAVVGNASANVKLRNNDRDETVYHINDRVKSDPNILESR